MLLVTQPPAGCRRNVEDCNVDRFLREGATVCVAWDGAAEAMLVSVDGAPFVSPFPAGTPVRPGAAAGAGLYPAIGGAEGMVMEYSMRGGLHLAPPSPDYRPFDQVLPLRPWNQLCSLPPAVCVRKPVHRPAPHCTAPSHHNV